MPRGTRHELTGLLLRHGPTLILRVDGGGEWRLDAPTQARRLVGRRMSVTGVRDGFDLLAVQHLHVCKGESGPRAEARSRSAGAFIRHALSRCILALFPYRSKR